MTDVLEKFRLEPGVYRLGQFTPVSIRDQVVRAAYLAKHLTASGELSKESRLVIIGAGAAGVTAAVLATRAGVRDVTLVERSHTIMSLQARTTSRWLDPVQYDWPASHWHEAVWPLDEKFQFSGTAPSRPRNYPLTAAILRDEGHRFFTAVNVPFGRLTAATSEDLAIEFQNRTTPYLGSIRTFFSTVVDGWHNVRGKNWFSVKITHPDGKERDYLRADIIILAVGFGLEQASVEDSSWPGATFRGLDFWSSDRFEQPNMGLSAPDGEVLVSGAGDGALQDFIRLSTGLRSAREVLKSVWPIINDSAWRERVAGLWHWDEQAARARDFTPSPLTECEVLNRLHKRYVLEVDRLADSPDWPAVVAWFDGITNGRRRGAVSLAFKCRHFSWCYPLNRFVALLIARYMEAYKEDVLLPGCSLRSTSPIGHGCGPRCWGRTHKVNLAMYVECAHSEAELQDWSDVETLEVQGLVIRHGIDPAKIGTRTLERLKPQTVPFHLP